MDFATLWNKLLIDGEKVGDEEREFIKKHLQDPRTNINDTGHIVGRYVLLNGRQIDLRGNMLHDCVMMGDAEFAKIIASRSDVDLSGKLSGNITPLGLARRRWDPQMISTIVRNAKNIPVNDRRACFMSSMTLPEDVLIALLSPDLMREHVHLKHHMASSYYLQKLEILLAWTCVDGKDYPGVFGNRDSMGTAIVTLLSNYEKSPDRTIASLRKRHGIIDIQAMIVASAILIQGQYLDIKKHDISEIFERFWSLVLKLPLELQMLVGKAVAGAHVNIVSSTRILREMLWWEQK